MLRKPLLVATAKNGGITESFFARLKVEEVHAESYQNLNEAYSSVFEYIEMFYNRVRRHSTIGHISPVEYENNYYEMCA